ncbi:DUF3632 domain-containing protein [Aspergillus melleus]|uniref:DUF3632 domain-containing protein n=1 Tax=Aspergillus melleus TaxID=138277 RepID=UPI001E8DCCE8|nr:uncharacterized protein LDX57_009716 [Aspergillus melleus]KAH8432068.1 hypothetical protein LDX57_009716 [Aspergillus melleus]
MSLSLCMIEGSTGTQDPLFQRLNEYLLSDGSVSAATTAQRINDERSSLAITDPGAFCQDTWFVFQQLIEQIPQDHPYQDRLVDVIEALTKLPSTEVKIWGETSPPEYNEKKADSWPEKARKWVSLNAFAARLLNLESVTWDNFGLWTMRDILENEISGPELENGIETVAVWIKYAGKLIYETSKASEQPEVRMFQPGPLYSGPSKYCPERWVFWKDRLGIIGVQGGETASRAQETKRIMEEFEG